VVVANLVKEEPSSVSNVDADRASRGDSSSEQLQDYFAVRNPALRNQIVAEHAELAYRLARKFTGRGEPYDDLVQVAFIGLIQAIERFDPDRGGTLASFAVPTILGELKRHFRDRAWNMRVPRRLQELYLEAKAVIDTVTQELGHSPTYTEIAARLEVAEEDLVEALEAGRNFYTLSLDAPTNKDDGIAVVTPSRTDPGLLSVENRGFLQTLAEGLPERTRRAVELRFDRDMTQTEISHELGVSQMQVSRMLSTAVHHMRRRAAT
jgi:RNA polymerase sigma-B factor